MNLTKIEPGMIVQVNVKGRVFNAEVKEKHPHYLDIMPLSHNITYFKASAREVKRVITR